MAHRPTIQDVAREAGVSPTTVDRAINGRTTVREETLRKIAEAARRIGYHGRATFDRRLNEALPEMRLGFVLLKKGQEFFQDLANEIEEAVTRHPDIRGTADIRFASSQSPLEFAEILNELGACCDAIAAVAVNDRRLDQVVQDLRGQGTPVFSLLNDFAQDSRAGYIGLNNMKVGRNAAWLVTRTARQPGKLAIFVGGNKWHGHDLREVGFRSHVREHGHGFTVLDTLVNLETRHITYEATLDLLDRHPDLSGIYVAGGGMEGAIAALREVHPEPKVSLVVNELTTESRAALVDGYVMMVQSTPLPRLCSDLTELMVRSRASNSLRRAGQHFLEPRVILPEIC